MAMVEAAPRLAAAAETLDLVCQTGTRDFDMVREAFERHGVQGRVERFIDAMDREMKAAGPRRLARGRDDAGGSDGGRPPVDSHSAADGDRRSPAPQRARAGDGGCGRGDGAERPDRRAAGRPHHRAGRRSREAPPNVGGGATARQAARGGRHRGCGDRAGGTTRAQIVSGVLGTDVEERVHFIGIGGIGMSGIAELLVNLGYKVSGSDMQRTDITDSARVAGRAHHAGARRAQRERRGGRRVFVGRAIDQPRNGGGARARSRRGCRAPSCWPS